MNDYTNEIKNDLMELSKKYLSVNHIAYDPSGKIQTGRNYQSVKIAGQQIAGFRTAGLREPFIFALGDTSGTILDIGSNLGETSRVADNGKRLILGCEYDEFTSMLANIISMASGNKLVTSIQCDISNFPLPASVDYILAFSVFRFISVRLKEIARVLNKLIIVETHNIDSDETAEGYWRQLKTYFSAVAQVGTTDHGIGHEGKRLVFAASHKRSEVWEYIFRLEGIIKDHPGLVYINPQKIGFKYLLSSFDDDLISTSEELAKPSTASEKLAILFKLSNNWSSRPANAGTLFNPSYWKSLLRGFLEYKNSNENLEPGNSYCLTLREVLARDADYEGPFRNELLRPDIFDQRVKARFAEINRYIIDKNTPFELPPPILLLRDRQKPIVPALSCELNGAPLNLNSLDGYHRLFTARLFGVRSIPACPITYDFS